MKKNLISIVILALLIINIVLTSIMMFSVVSTNKKTAALVTDIASAISLDLGTGSESEEEAEPIPMADVTPYTIADMTIPLARSAVDEDGNVDTQDHYAVLSVTLSMNSKHEDFETYGDLSTREDLIKGKINEVVSRYTIEDAKSHTEEIQQAILEGIQELFNSDFIFDVTLSRTLWQ